ncbi:unnamed protein product [Penicillium olsonii]|uniref:Amino acid transporter transmembrane domain-containing protein n=1 Tax=Penicillium olsonii TaxID=99116 RepID=A0A9W4MPE9_PENOL|nr:unnamed protein product [Penicillium olsonii]CAG8062546.1 unnamed protein product [Penicillium olsonii]CAG8285604.1 unnamed protein product [Penicillium olsonii]
MDHQNADSSIQSADGFNKFDSEKGIHSLAPSNSLSKIESPARGSISEIEQQRIVRGNEKFHRLGWKRLTVVLFVEAIALGCLSFPKSFATLGMVGGVVASIGIGIVATYASYEVGAVKVKYPHVEHYGDIGRLMLGEWGFWIITVVLILSVTLTVGSHTLTGIIALKSITQSDVCAVIFGLVSTIILLLFAIPPSFADIAILGYIDIVSILTAVGITIIATGIQSSKAQAGTDLPRSNWSAWPKEDTDFASAMVAINNIVFAYTFAPALPSFLSEMHTPKDYVKSVYSLGAIEIVLYTLIGSLVYVFVGQDVESPALLSAGHLISRIAFGIALPVIFISGSINTSVIARYIHGYVYRYSVVRYVNTKTGWITWIALVSVVSFIAWIIAEAIPVFSSILSISGALFSSGLCFYVPSIIWFVLIREGKWYHNLPRALANGFVFLFGLGVLGCGMYANVIVLVRPLKHPQLLR